MATLRLLFAIIVFLFVHCDSHSQHLISFENYRGKEICLPDDYGTALSKMEYGGSLLDLGNLMYKFRNVDLKILDQRWLNFFAEQNVTNGWEEIQRTKYAKRSDLTRQQQIDLFKNTDEGFTILVKSIAKYHFSNEFDSHLFLIERGDSDGYFKTEDLYLLNEKNGHLLSIVHASSFFLFDGHSLQTFSIRINDEIFLLVTEQLSTDNIGPNGNRPESITKIKYSLSQKSGYFK